MNAKSGLVMVVLVLALALPASGQVQRSKSDTANKLQQPTGQIQQSKSDTVNKSQQPTGQVAPAQKESQPLKIPIDAKSINRFETAVTVGFIVLLLWLVLVIAYLGWAIHRYGSNYGLSDEEWKTLYPEIYDKGKKISVSSKPPKNAEQSQPSPDQTVSAIFSSLPSVSKPFEAPTKNPYQGDSFGLPPGTIRGTIALTVLVIFLVVEGVNLYAPGYLEGYFDGLITALEMVLAFYFGSRAVEVLQTKGAKPSEKEESTKGSPPPAQRASTEEPPKAAPPSTVTTEPPGPTPEPPTPTSPEELPAMSYERSVVRVANIIANKTSEPTLPSAGKPVSAEKLSVDTPLIQRTLALTASFETSLGFPDCFGVTTGNFDGQGISFGALQWNIGQGSLQLLLQSMRQRFGEQYQKAFGEYHAEVTAMLDLPRKDQMLWAQSIQYTKLVNNRQVWYITSRWKDNFRALGKTPEMIQLQVENVETRFQVAIRDCLRFGLTTERGAALMFDINVQNGAVDAKGAGQRIFDDYATIDPALDEGKQQIEKMKIIARRRSEVSSLQWRDDVQKRKMTIAEGTGQVHGKPYNLENDFAISLTRLEPVIAPSSEGVSVV